MCCQESVVIRTAADLGVLVRERRQAVGLTATRAAELAQVSRRLLLELEKGKRPNVALAAVLRILTVLGLELQVKPRGLPGTSRPD